MNYTTKFRDESTFDTHTRKEALHEISRRAAVPPDEFKFARGFDGEGNESADVANVFLSARHMRESLAGRDYPFATVHRNTATPSADGALADKLPLAFLPVPPPALPAAMASTPVYRRPELVSPEALTFGDYQLLSRALCHVEVDSEKSFALHSEPVNDTDPERIKRRAYLADSYMRQLEDVRALKAKLRTMFVG